MTINTGSLKSSIGDRVWLDANNNGVQDAGEVGVANVTVNLRDGAGRILKTLQTDSNGNYLFTQLGAGQYAVEVVKPADYTFSSSDQGGNDAADSDVNQSTGRTGLYTLTSNQQNLTVDAGLVAPKKASLGDKVWFDANGNGQQDSGEAGVANVTVNLLNASGQVIATQVTNTAGNYLFTNLAAGQYSVQFVKPNGTTFTTANSSSVSDAADSDANTITGRTGVYTLAAGEQNLTVDAGLKAPSTTPARDAVTICEDLSKSFNVLTNDTGPGLKLIGVRHETSDLDTLFKSRGGAISFTADGQVTYKTMTNYYGNDKLIYTLQDAVGRTYEQFVDVKINPISDAPGNGQPAVYHPGQFDRFYIDAQGVEHRTHIYSYSDFGDFTDFADDLFQLKFGNYNSNVANDVDVRTSFVLYGLTGATAQYGKVLYNGTALDFSNGKSYEISVDDVKAGKLVLDFTNRYDVTYNLSYANKDSGTVVNGYCYNGEVVSPPKTVVIDTPVALDLNGDGHIGVTGATGSYQKDANAELGRTVQFDMNGDGIKDTIEWFDGSGDGILIDNRDGNAAHDMNGLRLFGGQAGAYGNGYYKLDTLDTNHDGYLKGAELSGIELWLDNGDAIVQSGEIQSLAQHGINGIGTQLSLTYDAQGKLHIESTATRTDGSTLMSEDVFFSGINGEAAAGAVPTVESVLFGQNDSLSNLLRGFMGGSASVEVPTEHQAASLDVAAADMHVFPEQLRKLMEALSASHVVAAA